MLPVDVRDALLTHARRGDLVEVVLDLGRCPEARFANGAPNQCLRAERERERGTNRKRQGGSEDR